MELNEQSLDIIKKGTIISSAVGTGILNSYTKDTSLQILINAFGAVIPEIINDFATRSLSYREKVKIGAVEAFTIHKIKQLQEKRKEVNPAFFLEYFNRPKIAELYEGILI